MKNFFQKHQVLNQFYLSQKKLPIKNHHQKISAEIITCFFSQLATLLSAGLPLIQSLNLLIHSEANIHFKNLLISIKTTIEAGKTFYGALQSHKKHIDYLSCQLIYIGEQTGTLDKILLQLTKNREKSTLLKKQLQQALLYPAFIIFTAIITLLIMMIFVVPHFAELFQSMHHTLPFFTRVIIFISRIMPKILACFLLLVSIFFIYYKKNPNLKTKLANFLLKVPLFQNILLTHFTQNLSLALHAGIPLNEALQFILPLLKYSHYQTAIQRLQASVKSGQQLHLAMHKENIFPKRLVQMIRVGEESGQLDHMLDKISQMLQAETDHFIAHFRILLEPLIIAILGVLIGSIVIGMYLPIFKLGTII